jgi:cysteine synthase A
MRIYKNNSLSIGNTPLVTLNNIAESKAEILAKIEGRNPTASIKARIASNMVTTAEKSGLLKPGMEIIEPTSGNTGIGLAFVGAARGYKVTLTMPESMSIERRKILKAFGANLILTETSKGMQGAISKAEELAAAEPERYFLPQQFQNPANPAIHEAATGPEIREATDGNIDAIVSGVGTGGTITGLARYFKNKKGKEITIIAVEPSESPVISQTLAGETLKPGAHKIQGIGAGFIPEVLDLTLIDRVEQVSSDEAFATARALAKDEGIMAGISSGAAVFVAAKLAQEPQFEGKTIVVILPDSGERYLSTNLYDV